MSNKYEGWLDILIERGFWADLDADGYELAEYLRQQADKIEKEWAAFLEEMDDA